MAIKPKGDGQEITERLAKFENPGDCCEGMLLSIEEDVDTKMGTNTIYRFEDESGMVSTVFGTAVLRRMLKSAHIGDWLRIEYVETKGEKGRETKMFRVIKWPGAASSKAAEPETAPAY